jgi:hypothetical protein
VQRPKSATDYTWCISAMLYVTSTPVGVRATAGKALPGAARQCSRLSAVGASRWWFVRAVDAQ